MSAVAYVIQISLKSNQNVQKHTNESSKQKSSDILSNNGEDNSKYQCNERPLDVKHRCSEFKKMEQIIDEFNKAINEHKNAVKAALSGQKSPYVRRGHPIQEEDIPSIISETPSEDDEDFSSHSSVISESSSKVDNESDNGISEESKSHLNETTKNTQYKINLGNSRAADAYSPKIVFMNQLIKINTGNEDIEEESMEETPQCSSQGYQEADDEQSESFEIAMNLKKRHKSVFVPQKKPIAASILNKEKGDQAKALILNQISQFRRDTIAKIIEKQILSKPKRSKSFDELRLIKQRAKNEQNRKTSHQVEVRLPLPVQHNNDIQEKQELLIIPQPATKLLHSLTNKNSTSDEQEKEQANSRIDLTRVQEQKTMRRQNKEKKKRHKKKKDEENQEQQDQSPDKETGSPKRTPKYHNNGHQERKKKRRRRRERGEDEKGGIGSDESVNLTDEEIKKEQNDLPPEQAVAEKKVIKETYKLTTSRYQGMLAEEYNEDDLELIRINSERNLLLSKIKSVSLRKAILVAMSTVLFIIDSEITWSYRHDYNDRVMYTVNVLRAFITMISLYSTILVIQKHFYNASTARLRHQLPMDLTKIFNRHELPLFTFEFFIHIIHFPPFLDTVKSLEEINAIQSIFQALVLIYWLKIITCLELMGQYSPLNSNKGRFIGSLSKTQITTAFMIKAWLKTYPLFALPIGIFAFLITNAYVLYVIERNSFVTTCFLADYQVKDFSFKNCFWCTIISFLTVGYGDIYPVSILGRSMNTVNIVGGMVSSATIIGLVHESMQLNHEEYHAFKFIKLRRKEQLRKKIAAKLVQLMLKMQVYRQRELNNANIKWKLNKDVQRIKSLVFNTVEKWKQINHELYVSHRRDHEQVNQMNHLRNIEEMLSGIAIFGANIWEHIKTEKLQRKMEVEQSFIKSKHDILRIQEEITRQSLLKRYQFQRFKTQRQGNQSLNGSRLANNKMNTSSFNNSVGKKATYANRLNSLAVYKHQESVKEKSQVLSRSSTHTKVNKKKTMNPKVPIINIMSLDQSISTKNLLNPITKLSNASQGLATLTLQLNQTLKMADYPYQEQNGPGQRNHIMVDDPKNVDENENEDMISEQISESYGSSEESKENVEVLPDRSKPPASIKVEKLGSLESIGKQKSAPMSYQGQLLQIKPQKTSVRLEVKGFTQNQGIKKNKTEINSNMRPSLSTIAQIQNNTNGVEHLFIRKQTSSSQNRDFVIEEDFEEDLTTPLSRGYKNKYDFNQMVSPLQTRRLNSDQKGASAASAVASNNSRDTSRRKREDDEQKKSDGIATPKSVSGQRDGSFKKKQTAFKPSTFNRKASSQSHNYGLYNLNSFRSERSIIEAIEDLKIEKEREKERDKEKEGQSKNNLFKAYNAAGPRFKFKGIAQIQNMEIEKKIEKTTYRRFGQNQKLFNSDSSSLYGSSSSEHLRNKETSIVKVQKSSKSTKRSSKAAKKKETKRQLSDKKSQDSESDLTSEKTAKEYKLFRRNSKYADFNSAIAPEDALTARRKMKNLQIRIPGKDQRISQIKNQPSMTKSLSSEIPSYTQILSGNVGMLNNQYTFKKQGTNQSLTSPPHLLNDISRLNLLQQLSQVSNGMPTDPNSLKNMANQIMFGGKSPIKFTKQSTTFSEQSAKELQNLLEPIDTYNNNTAIALMNLQQIQQQHYLSLLQPSQVHSASSHHQSQASVLGPNSSALDKSFIQFSPAKSQAAANASIINQYLSQVNIPLQLENQLQSQYSMLKSQYSLSKPQGLTKEIRDLKDQLSQENNDIFKANDVLESMQSKLDSLKERIIQKLASASH